MAKTCECFRGTKFLDLASYYKHFVEGFSKIVVTLTELTWKSMRFSLSDRSEASF